MAKDPALLFYTSDFLTGTAFFSMEQRGQYITLLCQQHQLGRIPKRHMLDICQTYDNPVWTKFKVDENGLYYNERLEIEANRRSAYCLSRKLIRGSKRHTSPHMSLHTYPRMETETDTATVASIKGGVGGAKRVARKVFNPPTLEEVVAYQQERNSPIDAVRFYDSNTARGWVDKNQVPYKDWKAVFRVWEGFDKQRTKTAMTSTKLPEKYQGD